MKYTFNLTLFQSLFYWKSYFNEYAHLESRILEVVSILVLLEVLLQQVAEDIDIDDTFRFQSLFYWKSYFNLYEDKK